jgi:N-formylglutamate deformylase
VQRFTGAPVYLAGQEPSADEVAARVQRYWRPYHDALATELARLHARHGRAVLWEGHSIRSTVPFLFDGRLPDFNLGTAAGASCAPERQARIEAELAAQDEYTWVANGRFKGGYITRHYGRPGEGVDALQLELAQCTYMDEATGRYQPERAANVQALVAKLLEAAVA